MKENKYDNEQFFEQYSQMDRSVKGLAGAGEWHELKRLLPDFKDKTVLDLGCGFGWHCIYAVENGAKSATGIDLSEKMLAVAREKSEGMPIEYLQMAIEDFKYGSEKYDVVISSLAFHYVKDFAQVCRDVFNALRPGGSFVFSVEHPVFTAYGSQQWFCDEEGKILHWPVDNYYIEGKRSANFLGEEVVKYHKTMTTYMNELLKAGMIIKAVVEPMPAADLLETVPGMKDELRRPMMLILAAEKPL